MHELATSKAPQSSHPTPFQALVALCVGVLTCGAVLGCVAFVAVQVYHALNQLTGVTP